MTLDVLNSKGIKAGEVQVADVMFDSKVQPVVMARALRAYLDNQHQGTSQAKTRAEVIRTTAKIYRQKGTGNARHGSRKAPIFVGGGVAHGPRAHQKRTTISKKMKRAALFGSLTWQVKNKTLVVIGDLSKTDIKTKDAVAVLKTVLNRADKEKVLVVMPKTINEVVLSYRNIEGVSLTAASRLNAHEVMLAKKLLVMKESLPIMEESYLTKSKSDKTVKERSKIKKEK